MNVSFGQLNITVGDVERNANYAVAAIERAEHEGADLLVLTELFTTGYPPRDLLFRDDLIDQNTIACEVIKRATAERKVAVIFGYVERNPNNGQKPLFNAAFCAQFGKKINGNRFKTLLPTYDVFDEYRYFEPGPNEFAPVEITLRDGSKVPVGIINCEECWNDADFWEKRLYDVDPVTESVKAGAKYLAVINASPYRHGVVQLRREMIAEQARKHRVGIVYVNQVGYNDSVGFDGNSFAVNDHGEIIAHAPMWTEDFQTFKTDGPVLPEMAYEVEWQLEIETALVTGVRDYFYKQGIRGPATIGLSGGIDSALVAYIAAKALGPNQVLGVGMPSEFSSDGSVGDAIALARTLGINWMQAPIKGVHNEMRHMFDEGVARLYGGAGPGLMPDGRLSQPKAAVFGKPRIVARDSGVTDENMQARIRGIHLMALSNYFGGLVLSTSNKTEASVGYTTLYGDMAGGLAVISDVWKGDQNPERSSNGQRPEVYGLCRWINEVTREEIIPKNTLTKEPSAELRPGQTDQQSLPPYWLMDEVLEQYVEKHVSPRDILKIATPNAEADYMRAVGRNMRDDITRTIRMTIAAEYKRQQAPTGLKVTYKLYKDGWDMPIVHKLGV